MARRNASEKGKRSKKTTKRTNPTPNITALSERIAKAIMKELRRDAYLDDDGTLVFYTEEAYARYLKAVGKRPSQVKAVFLDEHGFRFYYSDYELRPEKARELDRIRKEPTVPFEQVIKELGLELK